MFLGQSLVIASIFVYNDLTEQHVKA